MLAVTAVGYETDMLREQAEGLAIQLKLIVDNQILPRLCVTPSQLVLLTEGFAPLSVNFDEEYGKKRRHEGKNQGLIRACAPKNGMKMIDATAGWGRDALLLASFGAKVCMIERQPIIAALLADGLERLKEDSPLKNTLSLVCADAKSYLNGLAAEDYPDVIYIDPMHPARQKSALVKKNMQALQQLIGPEEDADQLIDMAMVRAKRRVVVKWPQRNTSLRVPSWSIPGKTVRFDVYNTDLKLT